MPLFLLHFVFIGLLFFFAQGCFMLCKIGFLLGIDFFKPAADKVGGYGGDTDEQQIHRATEPVEEVAGYQKQRPLTLLRHQVVRQKHHRHEGDKGIGSKQHRTYSSDRRVTRSNRA